ncbi:hypothetical protein A6X21_02370 [Planctopirus hydrillae]|uniref:Uncharacterized protein n=1 Tax=Planctopirus hydrillae TaxID=1841610 RepID=A0A1C3ERX6_9PLAN|nr:hypothetical protein A6X21_02370 [Planctopirus hydrillae]
MNHTTLTEIADHDTWCDHAGKASCEVAQAVRHVALKKRRALSKEATATEASARQPVSHNSEISPRGDLCSIVAVGIDRC